MAHDRARRLELADRVKAGTITQDQADRMAADLTQRITDLVNGTFSGRDGMGGPGGRHGHDGHQDHDGMGPGGFPGGSPDGTSGTSAPSA